MAFLDTVGLRFDNTYARLPTVFFAPATPVVVRAPRIAILNHALADDLGLTLRDQPPDALAALFTGQAIPPGAQPIAQAYAGHQYGGFTMLGDGRAILLGEHRTPAGRLVDVQFKGSGPTPFSRRGDGRAALGPMLREYVLGEAMHALGIPTTRALAVATTGEPVFRETALRGAVLTRVAGSHVRVGTFQYAAARRDDAALRALADYAIARHDPELTDAPDKYLAFLHAVIDRQAALVARWQCVGFVHGVMNTDNVAVSGETIDYGPCAFLDAYTPDTSFSSIDSGGRYAYGQQPPITLWNLSRFAETLLPLLADDEENAIALATGAVQGFAERFAGYWLAGMRDKLGLRTAEAGDADLAQALFAWMAATGADFTATFRGLSVGDAVAADCDKVYAGWHARWQERLDREGRPWAAVADAMRAVNPAVIPRNHRVEEALTAAERDDDFGPLHRLVAAVTTPFADTPGYGDPPPTGGPRYRTFCGT